MLPAILAALLFPVFARAHDKAKQIACLSNMRQLGMGLQLYLQDYDECFPASGRDVDSFLGSWVPGGGFSPEHPCRVEEGTIYPYVKDASLYQCPSDPEGAVKRLSYSMNKWLSLATTGSVGSPSAIILLIDDQHEMDNASFHATTDWLTGVHFGGGNLNYVDGHARWRLRSEVRYATKTPDRKPEDTVFPNDFNDFDPALKQLTAKLRP